jgi:peptidoglycan/LPS O-acetylase OafA/YrhL
LKNKEIYFENLDGFRTIAFLLVFVQHAISPLVGSNFQEGTRLFEFLRVFVSQGENGVSFFFVPVSYTHLTLPTN